jgi:hypothetical protein
MLKSFSKKVHAFPFVSERGTFFVLPFLFYDAAFERNARLYKFLDTTEPLSNLAKVDNCPWVVPPR